MFLLPCGSLEIGLQCQLMKEPDTVLFCCPAPRVHPHLVHRGEGSHSQALRQLMIRPKAGKEELSFQVGVED